VQLYSDLVLSAILTAAMLEVYYLAAVKRHKRRYAHANCCVWNYIDYQSNTVEIRSTSNKVFRLLHSF